MDLPLMMTLEVACVNEFRNPNDPGIMFMDIDGVNGLVWFIGVGDKNGPEWRPIRGLELLPYRGDRRPGADRLGAVGGVRRTDWPAPGRSLELRDHPLGIGSQ
jgi:hypothetical protein